MLARERAGYAMRLDVAAQEAALAQARALLPPLEKQCEQTRDLLRALVGKLPNEELEQSIELGSLSLPREPFWSLIGSVTQPLFTGGTLLHEKRAANQALLQAAAQYQQAVLTAYENVADTLHASLADARELAATSAAERAASSGGGAAGAPAAR